ncbi:hypothetical protein AB832_07060 [Flavobacteriaceae bacterium (ex Bugula neritina AB1)]|nr:hypothetical protein AB832_07060 [Flavobacteriaceae bacterium (ex Bugula neritina AB1)]
MPIPIIPILAVSAIIGGLFTLDWYYTKSKAEREEADRLAMRWFGNRFQDLAEYQRYKIQQYMDENFT